MPGEDGTGPQGLGSATGWGRGPCGAGMRRGSGRGFRRFGFRSAGLELSSKEQKKILEAELAEIDAEKKEIEKKLKEIK